MAIARPPRTVTMTIAPIAGGSPVSIGGRAVVNYRRKVATAALTAITMTEISTGVYRGEFPDLPQTPLEFSGGSSDEADLVDPADSIAYTAPA